MKKVTIIMLLTCVIAIGAMAQTPISADGNTKATYPWSDWTKTSSTGTQYNLYAQHAAGKAVLLDFYYNACGYCQMGVPLIEPVYTKYGSGSGNFVMFSLNVHDNETDATINQYRSTYGATNPYFAACSAQATEFGVSGVPAYFLLFPAKFKNPSGGTPDSIYGYSWGGYSATIGTEIEAKLQERGYLPQSINTPVNMETNISVYPNPVTDNFTVAFTQDNDAVIEVYNILGEKVVAPYVSQGSQLVTVDASALTNGFYFVKITQNNKTTTLKIQVVK